ncbi:hypothetical protein AOLI_G00026430 [Acnodon oligacanthus]
MSLPGQVKKILLKAGSSKLLTGQVEDNGKLCGQQPLQKKRVERRPGIYLQDTDSNAFGGLLQGAARSLGFWTRGNLL